MINLYNIIKGNRQGNNIYKTHIDRELSIISNSNSWSKEFVTKTLILFLHIKGHINFL